MVENGIASEDLAGLTRLADDDFKRRRFAAAAERYTTALAAADSLPPAARAALLNNRAACALALRRWRDAAADCDAALRSDPRSLKALLRRGLAREGLGDRAAAAADAALVLAVDPSVEFARQCLARQR